MRLLVLVLSLASAALTRGWGQSVAGEWDAAMGTPGGVRTFRIVFQVQGDSLSGMVKRPTGDVPLVGTLRGDTLRFSYTIQYNDSPFLLTVVATVTGDVMRGTVDLGGQVQEAFSARRVGTAPPPRSR